MQTEKEMHFLGSPVFHLNFSQFVTKEGLFTKAAISKETPRG
jgi:hypothetical protein